MRDIRDVYPGLAGTFFGPRDYGPLLESLGYDILLQVDDDDYQGDSRLILRDGARHGLLIFGWGSCTGCDALQACESYQDIDDLRAKIDGEILWHDGRVALRDFIMHRDWDVQYSYHATETKDFVARALALLAGENPTPGAA